MVLAREYASLTKGDTYSPVFPVCRGAWYTSGMMGLGELLNKFDYLYSATLFEFFHPLS